MRRKVLADYIQHYLIYIGRMMYSVKTNENVLFTFALVFSIPVF